MLILGLDGAWMGVSMQPRVVVALLLSACLSAAACGDVSGTPNVPVRPVVSPTPVVVTPPWQHQLSGVVYEPGVGPVSGAAVVVRHGNTVATDEQGRFSVVVDPGSVVSVSAPGLVTRYFLADGVPGGLLNAKIPLQPALKVSVPGSVSTRLYPDDPTYLTATEEAFWERTPFTHDCSPCRFIDLAPRVTGRTVEVRVRWSEPVSLTVWLGQVYQGIEAYRTAPAGERELTIQVQAPIERVLVGVASPFGDRQPIPGPIDLDIDVTLP